MVRVRAKDDGNEEDRATPVGSEGGMRVLGWGTSVTCGLHAPAELLKLKICGRSATRANFPPPASAGFLSLGHILVVLSIFQTLA